MISPAEKQIQEQFSQRWEVYRVATHELGGLHLVKDLEHYSLKQLYDLLEILDVHDALKKIAYDKAVAEQKQKS